ncbi:MAG: hypothetical protein ABL904_04800 [Hyphomicrobiaceae bacterium]
MRIGKAFQVATVFAAWIVWQSSIAAAQEIAVAPPAQVIGPLYAYGPAPVPLEAYGYQSRRSQPRSGYPNYRPRAPYGAYGGYRYPAGRGYQPGYLDRYAAPYWYGRPRYQSYAHQQRYAARIVRPRWSSGSPQALATVYPPQW